MAAARLFGHGSPSISRAGGSAPLWPRLTIHQPALARFEAATDRLCGDRDERTSSEITHLAKVVTASTGAQSNHSRVTLALSNQRAWSSRAGAAHVVDTAHYAAVNGTARPHFAKIFALKRELEQAAPGQWVLWVDTDVLFTGDAAALASVAERLRHDQGRHCQVFFDGGYWTNSGVILMQRSCAAARLLDAWLALTDFNQLAADQGPFDLAVLHAVLGLNATRSVDELRSRPCMREPPANLVPCVNLARRRASHQPTTARRVCGAANNFNTGWSNWIPGTLLAHFPGAGKQCMAPFARSFQDGAGGWRDEPNATWVRASKCRLSRGLREMCCATGAGGGCLCEKRPGNTNLSTQ